MAMRSAVLGLTFLLVGASASAAQVFEPFSRAQGVRFPAELAAAAAGPTILADGEVAAVRTTGEFPVLAIPALFEDSPIPVVPVDTVQKLLFGTEGRTVTTFYQEMSGGALTVTGFVPDWVRTDITVREAAGSVDGHGWIGDRANDHFAAAVIAADPAVDYRQFDNDGPDGVPDSGDDDGYVDAVTFKFTEVAGSCGGPGFWPHRSSLQEPGTGEYGMPTDDIGHNGLPIKVLGYTTESVIECDGRTPQGPNTMSHEFGHILGLPDFYRAVEGIEATERHWMIGCFGLMAAGSWGCGTDTRVYGFGPTGFSPLSRSILGWGTVTDVGSVRNQEYTLEPVQTSGQILKAPLSSDGSEYLLIEYRPAVGFDDQIPAGGILVYHVDESADIFGGAYAETFPHWLVEADANGGLRRTIPDDGDRGVPDDVFARNGAVDSLTPATVPSTALASGEPSTVWIHEMAVEGGVARIRISTVTSLVATPVSTPRHVRALEPVEFRYAITGGTPPYEAVAPPGGIGVVGLSIRMDGSEVVIGGTPLDAGRVVTLPFHVRDADGDAWWHTVEIPLADASLTEDQLLDPLLEPGTGDPDLLTYLDTSGNENGSYDLGDLRAYVLRVW